MDALTPFAFGATGTTYRAANIPVAIGTAAAQTALIAAQTIPALEQGDTTGKHEGQVMINDAKGAKFREIVQRTSGQMEVYSGRNVVIDKKRGDKVYKAGQAPGGFDYNDLVNASINMSLADQYGRMSQAEAVQTFDFSAMESMMDRKLSEFTKAVKTNKTVVNVPDSGASFAKAMRLNKIINK